MSGWQVGDLALCVRKSPGDSGTPSWGVAIGAVVTVAEIETWGDGEEGLNFYEDPNPSDWRDWCFLGCDFIKVTAPEADEFDREVIEHLTGAPVKDKA